MSIATDLSLVTEVLLADGWHTILPGSLTVSQHEPHIFSFREVRCEKKSNGILGTKTLQTKGPATSILAWRIKPAPTLNESNTPALIEDSSQIGDA